MIHNKYKIYNSAFQRAISFARTSWIDIVNKRDALCFASVLPATVVFGVPVLIQPGPNYVRRAGAGRFEGLNLPASPAGQILWKQLCVVKDIFSGETVSCQL